MIKFLKSGVYVLLTASNAVDMFSLCTAMVDLQAKASTSFPSAVKSSCWKCCTTAKGFTAELLSFIITSMTPRQLSRSLFPDVIIIFVGSKLRHAKASG